MKFQDQLEADAIRLRGTTAAVGCSANELDAIAERIRKAARALGWIAQQECGASSPSAAKDMACCETQDCITEWCLPCYATGHLRSRAEGIEL